MTVKEFAKKYNVPEKPVWDCIEAIFSTAEKPFVKDENQNYSEDAMYVFTFWEYPKNGEKKHD